MLSQPDAGLDAMSGAIALEDHEFHEPLDKICTNDFVSKFDGAFGEKHSTQTALGGSIPDGIFQGTWPRLHTFIGCFDDVAGTDCDLAIIGGAAWTMFTAHWTWK